MKIIQSSEQVKKNFLILMTLILISISTSAQHDSLQVRIDSLEWKLQLKEVSVVAKKKLFVRKNDRLIFNVENSIINSGSNAIDALRITPGIRVLNDEISMVAKSGFTVTINDKIIPLSGEDLSNYLKGISTASIKSIEIISTPPAKYEAEGNSGIINIVLKNIINNSWNLNLRGAYTQARYSEGNLGVDFNLKKDKVSIYSNITTDLKDTYYYMKNYIYYPTETWVLSAPFKGRKKYFNGNVGFDYFINNNWEIGVVYFNNISSNIRNNNNISTDIYNSDFSLKEYMNTVRNTNLGNNLNALNFHSINKIDSLGKKISIDFDYFTYNSTDSVNNLGNSYNADNSLIINTYYAKANQNIGRVINYSAKINVDLPTKWSNLNFGTKITFSKNNNDFKFYDFSTSSYIIDDSQTNIFSYKEKIIASYFSANKEFTKKFSVQIGLRFEYTSTEGNSQSTNLTTIINYSKLFPTCFLNYQLSDENSLSLNYSNRINRPPFFYLNPYKSYFNSFDYNEGNPFLKPSYSNNLEFSINTEKFEHKLWYSSISDDYFEFPFVNPQTKVVRHFPLNCINYFSTGLSESFLFDKFWWWNSYNNGVFYYMQKKATIDNAIPMLKIFSGKLFSNNDFILNKKKSLILNLGGYYEFPYIAAYNNIGATFILNSGIKLILLNRNLAISLTANDILKTNHAKSSLLSGNIKYVYDNYGDTQNIRLYVSYKLGNLNIRSKKHDISNKEERDRVN